MQKTKRPENIKPTPETAAKLRYDVIGRLETEGRLPPESVWAAQEIRRIWEAMGRSIFSGYSDTPRQPHSRNRFDPLDKLSKTEEIAWRARYRPWTREMAREVVGAVKVTKLQLVLDVVVDNYRLGEIERLYRIRGRGAREHLQTSLHRYAVISGWTTGR